MAEEIEARNLQREPNENTMEFGRRVREARGEVLPAPVENIFTEDEEEEDAYANFFSARKNQYKTETIGPMLEARGLDPKLAVDPNYVMPSIEQEQKQEKLTDEVLSQDKNWIAASKVMWETNENAETKKREGREEFYNTDNLAETIPYNPSSYKEPPTEDKDWGKYGIEMMGFFNYNIPHMGIDTVRLSEAEPWQRVAFYYMMSGYDQLGVSWNGTKRLFKGMFLDPSTYVGLGALGLGVKQVGKALGKDAIKLAIKQLKKTGAITGVEAGAYTAIDNFMRQKNAIGAGAQEEFDLMELLKMTGFGVTAGVTLGAGIPGIGILGKSIFKKKDEIVTTAKDLIDRVEIDPNTVSMGGFGGINIEKNPARVGTTGQYVGYPEGINTPNKLYNLRNKLTNLAKEGEEGKYWYEKSGQAILDAVGGDKVEAEKLIQAIAITSTGSTPVQTNMGFALQAYSQWKAGKEILTGKYPVAMSKRLKDLFEGKDWEGRKSNSFYNNLMRVVDPSREQNVTADIWMGRILGLKNTDGTPFSGTPSLQQYNAIEREVNRVAKKLDWESQQAQAAMWVAAKARSANKPVSEMKFDYSDALKKNLGLVSWETKPSQTSGHFPEIFNAEMKEQVDFHFRMSKSLIDDKGNDLLSKEVGLLTPGSFDAPGIYEGVLSPGTQTQALMPMKYKGQSGEVDEATLDLIKVYAVSRGILLKQDSIGAHRVFYKQGKAADRDAVSVDIGRSFTNDEIKTLDKLLTEEFGTSDFSPASTEYGVNIVHWMGERGKMNFTEFQKKVRKVLNILEISDITTNSGKLEAGTATSQKVYVTNTNFDTGTGWKEAPNGENYLEGTFGERPDLQERVRTIVTKFADRVDAVEDEIVREYGWTKLDYNSAYKGKQKEQIVP